MFARIKASGRSRSLTRRMVTFLGSLLTLALVLGTLGFIQPSRGNAAPVAGSEPYTIDLEYTKAGQNTCNVYDTTGGFCSQRDDQYPANRYRDVARLLVNTEDYPTKNGPLTVVLRAPRRDVSEITPQDSIGGKAAGSADPTVTHGSQTINGVDYTTLTISWEKFDALYTSELVVPIWLGLQNDVPNGVPFTLSAEATPGTAAQAANPPSLTFAVQYRQQASVLVHNSGSVQQGGLPTVIGAPRSDTNGYLPTDTSALTRSSLSLQVPSLDGARGVRTAESAKVVWTLPEYDTASGKRKPLVQIPENSDWTISADRSTATRTFTVPAGTEESQYNAVLKREIEAAELSMYFPGIKDSTDLSGINGFSATITYTPLHPAENEQSIVASTNTGLHINSAVNNKVGFIQKLTAWSGTRLWDSLSDTEQKRKNNLPWKLTYTNTSGLTVHHLVLTDELPQNDTTLKLVGFRGLTITGFDSSKSGCQSINPGDVSQNQCHGDITNVNLIQEVRAYTDATHYDTYSGSQLAKETDGIEVWFDTTKTYVRFDIVFAVDVPVNTSVTLLPFTQFRDVKHPAYRDPPAGVSADTFNSHVNNGSASGQFRLDEETVSAQTITSGASVVVKEFSEWLDLQAAVNGHGAGAGNEPLAVIGKPYRHNFDFAANIDDSKDWSSAKVIILLPSSFKPNGVTDLTHDKDGLSCVTGSGANGAPGDKELLKSTSYRHNYAGGRNALIVSLNPDALKKMQSPDRGSGARKQLWTYVDGTIDSNTLEGNTGTFDEYFTSDVAPAQSGEGTVPDIYHFGPNPNIVHSSFTYMMVEEGNGGSLFFDKRVSAFKDGNAGVDVGILPGKEFYYRLILGNSRDLDTGKVTFMDGLPVIGDVMPQDGGSRQMDDQEAQGRKTQFPVHLSGPITATVSAASNVGSGSAATNVTFEYTTAADAGKLTMSQMSSLTWRPASDFGSGAGKTPWTAVTGFKAVCANVPSKNALMLTVPAIVTQEDASAAAAATTLAQSGVPTDLQKTKYGLVDTRDGGISDHQVAAVNVAARELDGTGSGTGSGRIKQTNPVAVSLTRGGFVIRKTDANDTSQNLKGAKFTLAGTGANSGVNLSATTDETGKATFLGLLDGTYTLTETQAPNGYLLPSSPITVTVKHLAEPQQGTEGVTQESVSVTMSGHISGKGTATDPYVIADQKLITALPRAGGTGVAVIVTAIVALLALGLMLAVFLIRFAPRGQHVRG